MSTSVTKTLFASTNWKLPLSHIHWYCLITHSDYLVFTEHCSVIALNVSLAWKHAFLQSSLCAGSKFVCLDYAPILHSLNSHKLQYNALIVLIKKNASMKIPKSIGMPLKEALSACTNALK